MPLFIVVGLRPKQIAPVERRLSGKADLRFVDALCDRPRLPRGDHCLLLVRSVGHHWTTRAFKIYPRDRVHYVMGGVGDTVKTIEGLL